ncbi:hypothetical protein HXA31_17860 [Salipaludibacillus agaradhaerens]|uniref:Uncharacterized protein n=2 Tax=Salipaludibacillus agaradhaerens TaxID=76935 RepID=A0A9Q4B4B8_SALAG|nr:hypothetical protein [Salipaludibacillus agaradhaerens]MCR6116202.1 hypothetical protein [Salipaludibacillus agaradhaerens]
MKMVLFLTVSFIIIGFVVVVSMKGKMERKLAFIQENADNHKNATTPIILWIVGTTFWGLVSMALIIGMFFMN